MRSIVFSRAMQFAILAQCLIAKSALFAELPNPVLQCVYPSGTAAGTSVVVTVYGTSLEGLRGLQTSIPGLVAEKQGNDRFQVSIPEMTPPGIYDLRTVTDHGISAPRAFMVSARAEKNEGDSNETVATPTQVELNSVINGRIEKPGDVDCFRFAAKAGQRVIVECWAERIDSQLRGVIEVFNEQGQRLAANRGHTGLDPLVDFHVPSDGLYDVRLFDLTYLGSHNHFYRLDIDALARPEFALPCVVTRGQTSRVKIFGRNLSSQPSTSAAPHDMVEVEINPSGGSAQGIRLPRRPPQIEADALSYLFPGGHLPIAIGVTDLPVLENTEGHDRAELALELPIPVEVSGQIANVHEQHWYAFDAKRGEVLWFEAFGERIGAPVDLDLSILDPAGERELAKFSDQLKNLGGYQFSTAHTDPTGRWVAPGDGRYLVLVRNLNGGAEHDPRRIYRLSIRREVPDYQLAVVSRRADQPAAWNIPRGGREWMEVFALRRRGMTGPIRVVAEGLPAGMEFEDTWIGPGQNSAPLVVTSTGDAASFAGVLKLTGHADQDGVSINRQAFGGTMVWPGRPLPSGRVAQEVVVGTGIDAPMLLTATPQVKALDQHSVLDVEVTLESHCGTPASPVRLSGAGLPPGVELGRVTVAPETTRCWISFFWPASLPPGPYTFAIQAEFEAPVTSNPKMPKPVKTGLTVVSNPMTVEIKPARIILEVDPSSPTRIARGKIIQLRFTAERVHGFLGKMHTELVAPGGVAGVRSRGVTLTGQSDNASIQVLASDDAPLGRQLFLRLETIGTVEDQPIYRAGRPVELEIVE